jgi:hypothetical protein
MTIPSHDDEVGLFALCFGNQSRSHVTVPLLAAMKGSVDAVMP